MKPANFNRLMRVPPLTRFRIFLALAVAVGVDGIQFLLAWLGWAGADQAMDLLAMILTTWILGFHWLLLPTFALELVPILDDLPTWTACVVAVVALRRRAQKSAATRS